MVGWRHAREQGISTARHVDDVDAVSRREAAWTRRDTASLIPPYVTTSLTRSRHVKAAAMLTNRIFRIVMLGKIIA